MRLAALKALLREVVDPEIDAYASRAIANSRALLQQKPHVSEIICNIGRDHELPEVAEHSLVT